mgnify:CR=1 FL=1
MLFRSTLLSPYIKQQGGVLTLPSAIEIIKAQTDLKNDRDAYTLLNSATAQGLLTLDKGPVYNIVDKNGEIVGTYETEKDARDNAGKRDIVQKSIAQRVAIAQEPKAKRTLPKGFEITKTQVEGEVTPAGYQISDVEGKPFPYLVEKLEDLQGKVDQMEGARRAEAEREISGALKIRDALQKRRDNLVKMEALGQADTAEYRKALNQQVIAEREFSKRIQRLLDRAERLKGPLRTKPVGRTVTPKDVYTLTQNGKEIGKFGSEEDAYASMFLTPETEGGLSEAELEDIAVKGGNLGNRAQKALDERQTKGIARKITPALQAKREFVAKAEEIAKNLMPVLKRFGLGNIGLKIVDALEKGAEGKYENQLIHLVMSVKEPLKTLRHESIHALKELGFFTDAQWEALERQADKEWINTYLKNKPYTKGISRYDAYYEMFKNEGKTPQQIQDALREEAIADAFADFANRKPPAGMIAALLARLNNFFTALRNAIQGAGFNTAEDIFNMVEAGELKPNSWKATPKVKAEAEAYDKENGILPYTSEGQLDVPLESDGAKYSIKSPYTEAQAKGRTKKTREGKLVQIAPKFNDPVTGLPLNSNGTVTLYYPTTNEGAREMARVKRLRGHSPEATRIYLTNESSASEIEKKPGDIDQPVGGANVLLQVYPS